MAKSSKWNTSGVKSAAHTEVVKRMMRAAIFVKDDIKKRLNRGNPTGENPSAEGESPKKVSALLFGSITAEVVEDGDNVMGGVGTNVEYAPRLEFGFHGTDKAGHAIDQGERPFMRPGLSENSGTIRKILGSRK